MPQCLAGGCPREAGMHQTIARLRDALNAHDPDAQVHVNWSSMFAGVPVLVAVLPRTRR